jgi:hypothetical protein
MHGHYINLWDANAVIRAHTKEAGEGLIFLQGAAAPMPFMADKLVNMHNAIQKVIIVVFSSIFTSNSITTIS